MTSQLETWAWLSKLRRRCCDCLETRQCQDDRADRPSSDSSARLHGDHDIMVLLHETTSSGEAKWHIPRIDNQRSARPDFLVHTSRSNYAAAATIASNSTSRWVQVAPQRSSTTPLLHMWVMLNSRSALTGRLAPPCLLNAYAALAGMRVLRGAAVIVPVD